MNELTARKGLVDIEEQLNSSLKMLGELKEIADQFERDCSLDKGTLAAEARPQDPIILNRVEDKAKEVTGEVGFLVNRYRKIYSRLFGEYVSPTKSN